MPATPTTKKGLRTRNKILDAAGRVFARDGYVEARMLDIATEAGLSTGGLYRYFDNKTEVFAALIADLHEEFYNYSGHTRQLLARGSACRADGGQPRATSSTTTATAT